jgi:Protein of unknown function (DUF2924)
MSTNVSEEVANLQQQTVAQLRSRYAEVFGETTKARHKTWLIKRIAWRLQALAEGDLSERARRRAAELANDADLRWAAPRAPSLVIDPAAIALATKPTAASKKPLLLPGTVLSRAYKGRTLQVKVLAEGFLYGDAIYQSLSAVAKAITGTHCNGISFFHVGRKGGSR